MATGSKIYLHNIVSDLGTAAIDAVTKQCGLNVGVLQGASAGSTFDTLVTNTQNNPASPIQMTETAGGSVVCWVTPPLAAAVTLSNTTMLVNIRGLESNAAANAAIGVKITKYSGGVESTVYINSSAQTNIAELDITDKIDGTTLGTAYSPTTVTSTTLARGDRLVIRLYIMNASGVTMASGQTVTASYNGETGAAAGDSWIQFGNETVAFEFQNAPTTFDSGSTQAFAGGASDAYGSEFPQGAGNVITGSGVNPAQP